MGSKNSQAGLSLVSLIVIVAAIFIAFVVGQHVVSIRRTTKDIIDYASCIKARGAKLLQTYPEQCVAYGKVFVNPDQTSVSK